MTKTPEEVLLEAGLDPSNPKWVQSKPLDLSQIPVLEKQRALLSAIREALITQVQSDQRQLEEAREKHSRLKRGGS